jgi:hypothetical protein
MPMMTDYRASNCHGAQPGITLCAFSNHTADWSYLKTSAVILIREKPARTPSVVVVRVSSAA